MKRTQALWLGLGIVLVACGGDDSSSGGGGSKTLISSSSVPADATCPNGGTKLSVGTDTNGNGTLDANEVTGSQEICNSAPATLTTVTPTGPDSTCKNGGVIVKSGPDTNGNGKLDDSEVTQTTEICDGGNSAVLSITTALQQGDPNCPLGGTETQSGPDNGNAGGIAGNGVLETGEITSTTYACSTLPGFFPGTFSPPPAVAGQQSYVADLHGGSGGGASPGNGGAFLAQKTGTLGGHVKIFKTGQADASFTMPAYAPEFGATKLDVTADTTLLVHADGTSAADGEYYFVTPSSLYFRQNSGNNQVPVTGLHVAAGTTFTLPTNVTGITGLTHDVHVEGNIVAFQVSGSSAPINIATVGAFVSAAGAKLSAAGAPVANSPGGSAGIIGITASTILNQAAFDVTGADGGATGVNNGGSGGAVTFTVPNAVGGGIFNTGTLTGNGGNGTGGGSGGQSLGVLMQAANGGIHTSGAISFRGGNGSGTTGTGGSGGTLQMQSSRGSVDLSGGVHLDGGNASAGCTGACIGGNSNGASMQVAGGRFAMNGDYSASGGKGVGAAGGSSSGIGILLQPGTTLAGSPIPVGNATLSGNITTNGGDGTSGGVGGNVIVQQAAAAGTLFGQEIVFLGYTDIKTYGGDGSTGGGTGGAVQLVNGASPGAVTSTGGVINYANLTTHGGTANVSGTGGAGGAVSMRAGTTLTAPPDKCQVVFNAGDINGIGANGFSGAGVGTTVQLQAVERLDSTGTFTLTGGNSASDSVTAANGGGVSLFSGGGVGCNTAITSNGGNANGATASGGTGGSITFLGIGMVNTKGLTSNGGNSNGVAGGGGGIINFLGQGSPSQNTGPLSVAGGTGTPNGPKGTVIIDGIVQP